jgi:dynein heavy chain 1
MDCIPWSTGVLRHGLTPMSVPNKVYWMVRRSRRGKLRWVSHITVKLTLGIPGAKKKFAELELSLLHLKQNVEIPEAHLSVHPAIRKAVAAVGYFTKHRWLKCRLSGSRVSIDAVDSTLLSEPSFLNKLQADVNSWIKEIQAVTKLSRDVNSGTASQEINFWISMENALESIEAQLKGEEVTLALDVLKHAKRFHATVSFIADTGLKEATDIGELHQSIR